MIIPCWSIGWHSAVIHQGSYSFFCRHYDINTRGNLTMLKLRFVGLMFAISIDCSNQCLSVASSVLLYSISFYSLLYVLLVNKPLTGPCNMTPELAPVARLTHAGFERPMQTWNWIFCLYRHQQHNIAIPPLTKSSASVQTGCHSKQVLRNVYQL